MQYGLAVLDHSISDDEYLFGVGDARQQDIATDPSCSPGGRGQWWTLFDDVLNEEVLWDNEQIAHTRADAIVHQH